MTTCQCIYCPMVALNLQLCDVLVKKEKNGFVCLLPKKGTETYNKTQREEIVRLMVSAVAMGENLYGNAAGDYSNSSCQLHIKRLGKKAYKLCVHAEGE